MHNLTRVQAWIIIQDQSIMVIMLISVVTIILRWNYSADILIISVDNLKINLHYKWDLFLILVHQVLFYYYLINFQVFKIA